MERASSRRPGQGIAFGSERVVHGACREVHDRDAYTVVADPANPRYRWGNYLQLTGVPVPELAVLETAFATELPASWPRCTFGWDDDLAGTTTAALASHFTAAGYTIDECVCLTLAPAALVVPVDADGVEVRPVVTDADWAAATANQHACRDDPPEVTDGRMAAFRRAVGAGAGCWMGAFDRAGHLAGDCGVFWHGPLARFQAVGVAPDVRRRGIAATLVAATVAAAEAVHPAGRYVILTGVDAPARRVYERLGFMPVARSVGAIRAP